MGFRSWIVEGPNGKPWYRSVRWSIAMYTVLVAFSLAGFALMDRVTS